MEYEKSSDRTYEKNDGTELKAGYRNGGNDTYSLIEREASMKVEKSEWGETAGAGARAHAFRVVDDDVDARLLGADVGAKAGIDMKCFSEEGHILGAEAKARATLIEAKTGPVNLHLGAGVSTAAKVEGGALEAKLAGCGFKVGTRVGVSVFDNEISVDTLALVGKGWLWGR